MHELWSRARVDEAREQPHSGQPADVDREVRSFVIARDWTPNDGNGTAGVPVPDDPGALPYELSRALTMASIARRAGSALMLHAAGVCDESGAVLALVAPSGTGKTTAAARLSRELRYVTDETICIEVLGGDPLAVSAYAKPLSVVIDPARPGAKDEHSPDELGLGQAPRLIRAAGVVLLERHDEATAATIPGPGAATTEAPATEPAATGPAATGPAATLEPIGLIDGLIAVIPQTSSLLALPAPLATLARVVALSGGPWVLRYTEIEAGAAALQELLAGIAGPETTQAPEWEWVPGPLSHPTAASAARAAHTGPTSVAPDATPTGPRKADDVIHPDTLVRRVPWRDAILADDEALVIVDTIPLRLSALGMLIWRGAEHPVAAAELLEEARAELGSHPDAEALVTAGLRAMSDMGLIVLA